MIAIPTIIPTINIHTTLYYFVIKIHKISTKWSNIQLYLNVLNHNNLLKHILNHVYFNFLLYKLFFN